MKEELTIASLTAILCSIVFLMSSVVAALKTQPLLVEAGISVYNNSTSRFYNLLRFKP